MVRLFHTTLGRRGSEANENNPDDGAQLQRVPNANKPLALAQFKFFFDMNNYTNIVTDSTARIKYEVKMGRE